MSSARRQKARFVGRERAPSPELPQPTASTSVKRTLEQAMPAPEAPTDPRIKKKARRTQITVTATRSDPAEGSSLRRDIDAYIPHHRSSSPPRAEPPAQRPVGWSVKPMGSYSEDPKTRYYVRTLQRTRAEVDSLRQELAGEKQAQHMRELKIKQDMMLDIIAHRKRSDDAKAMAEMERNRYMHLLSHHKDHVEKLEIAIRAEKARSRQATSDATMWKEEADHMSAMYKTLEEDLDELRRLENEQRSVQSSLRQREQLPPAYGNLDDEDRLPPWETHARDSGSLEVAIFKRTVRAQFMRQLIAANAASEHLRSLNVPEDQDTPGAVFFRMMSASLDQAAGAIERVLKNAVDVSIQTVQAIGADVINASLSTYRPLVRRMDAKEAYIADRGAKLLIDLSTRLLSVFELRPMVVRLKPTDKAAISLAWTRVDEKLTECLIFTFNDSTTPHRLWEMQHYLTQVSVLHEKFSGLRTGLSVGLFEKSWVWLSDHVDVERQLAAQDAELLRDRTVGVPGSEVSSDVGRQVVDLTED